ncbi:Maf family protein [Bacillus sp. MUM 13]|uniref:Maf family protein n=1 Tax=Bacillus sp. MUM 13 TaxID=1678001 RepID=UPI0008F5EAD8|nr:Maf family protein [Bacillus sp. MUM 13]OIK14339.1 septum formation protein Maf [Bacillus sp. MUM 13]
MKDVILASSSPRRKELLNFLQIPFQSVPSNIDETIEPGTSAAEAVKDLAYRKAAEISGDYHDHCIIGSDTVVSLNGEILGKPSGREDAKRMLQSLSGCTHTVHTGVAIMHGARSTVFSESTEVVFWELSDDEIENYLDSGEPFDKAGSYGIQGFGSLLVKEIHGDYFTVVGLPVSRLARELKAFQKKSTS